MARLGYVFMFLVILTVVSCLSSHTERITNVDPWGWGVEDTVQISYANQDTAKRLRIDVLFRWDDNYLTKTLPCEIITITPDSVEYSEVVELSIPSGKLNRLTTGYRDSELPYRSGVVLNKIGEYKFKIVPSADHAPLHGVWAVGIRVE